jgi:hypothetical protein
MRNIKKSLRSALGLALVPVALSSGIANAADKLSYSYLEAEYVFGDELDLDIGGDDKFDVDGTRFKGSAGLTDNVFAWGSSTSLDVDLPSPFGDTNFDSQSLGIGGNFTLVPGARQLDAWGGVSYERLDAFGETDDGYGLNAGLRWAALEVLELNASASLRDYDDEAWVYGVGAVYSATPQLGLVANWERWELDGDGGVDPEMDLFSVGFRWTFR